MTAVSRTAAYVAMYRALETLERDPVVRDPLAARLLPRNLRLLLRAARVPAFRRLLVRYADRRAPGARTSAIARTALIDALVREAVEGHAPDAGEDRATARAPVRQLVLLGAGFDCRAHRMPELADTRVFEVDRAPTQAIKRAYVPMAATVTYVAVDFLRDDVFEKLGEAGWLGSIPTLFVWEGVTNYLTEEVVLRVLRTVAERAPGSTIVFTYIHRGVLDHPADFVGGPRIVANVKELGEPWTFGLLPSEVAGFVDRSGLVLRHDEGADDYRRRFLGAADLGYAFYRLAVAEAPAVPRYRRCDECHVRFLGASSEMDSLCSACAERLFGYPPKPV